MLFLEFIFFVQRKIILIPVLIKGKSFSDTLNNKARLRSTEISYIGDSQNPINNNSF